MANRNIVEDEVVIPSKLKFSKIIVWVMYAWVLIGVVALSIRVFLLAFSANTSAGFTNFILNLSNDYLQPFRGIFPSKSVGETGYLDVSAIFAIIIYLFILWGFRSLIDYVQNKIDLDKEMQIAKILEAKRQAEIAKREERERLATENLKEILSSPSKKPTQKQTRVVS
jgi:uncharacterized protein YggT (Ycf19 family)